MNMYFFFRVQPRDNIALFAELEVDTDQWSDQKRRKHRLLGERNEIVTENLTLKGSWFKREKK